MARKTIELYKKAINAEVKILYCNYYGYKWQRETHQNGLKLIKIITIKFGGYACLI